MNTPEIEPISLPIYLENLKDCDVNVRRKDSSIIAEKVQTKEKLFEFRTLKFQHLHIKNSENCNFFITCKFINIFLYKCHNINIKLTAPVIGLFELYECDNIKSDFAIDNILLSISGHEIYFHPISCVTLENTKNTKFIQPSYMMVDYHVKLCIEAKIILNEPQASRPGSPRDSKIDSPRACGSSKEYEIGKLLWDEDEINKYSITKDLIQSSRYFTPLLHSITLI